MSKKSLVVDSNKYLNSGLEYIISKKINELSFEQELLIKNLEFGGYGLSGRGIKAWKVRAFLRRISSRKKIKIIKKKSDISLIKTYKEPTPDGLSICFVSDCSIKSANLINLSSLAIDNFICNRDDKKIEILICIDSQPNERFKSKIMEAYSAKVKIKFLECNAVDEDHFYINTKKSLLWQKSSFERCIFLHDRISVTLNLLSVLFEEEYEAFTPKILFEGEPYLDLIFYSHNPLKLTKQNVGPFLCSNHNIDCGIFYAKGMFAYADGACIALNKALIKTNVFEETSHIPWGEAEDVHVSTILNAMGVYIDYKPYCEAHSNVTKVPPVGILKQFFIKMIQKYKIYRVLGFVW